MFTISIETPDLIVVAALLISFALFLFALVLSPKVPAGIVLRNLFTTVDLQPITFDPTKTGGTNLTLGTTILAAIINAKLLPQQTKVLPTPETYTYLQIFFGALLVLSLVIYFCGAKRLGAYLVADWLVFGAAFGVVATVGVLLQELAQYPRWTFWLFEGLLTLTALAIVWGRIQITLDTLSKLWAQLEKDEAARDKARSNRLKGLAPDFKVKVDEILTLAQEVRTGTKPAVYWEVK
ncbi:MAG: hypothetical protein HYU86_07490 [Chloroflexi bacterium]|nr:hypothetical protein [Chloroflexota bacterium]